MAVDTMVDISLTRPLQSTTFISNKMLEFQYSGRKPTTKVSVSYGDKGELRLPSMTTL